MPCYLPSQSRGRDRPSLTGNRRSSIGSRTGDALVACLCGMPAVRFDAPLTLERLWLFLAVALPALVCLLVPIPAVDLAYQVRAGDEILRTGVIPAVDTYTFTVAGTPWTDQQWLAQVFLALGFRAGGWELLVVLRAVLVSAAFGLLAATAMAKGARPRTGAFLSLLAFALAAPALALRPQLFAIAIFAALLLLVARRHRNPRVVWLAPLLVIAWANIHGSFVLAPMLLGYAWLDDLVRGRPSRAAFALLLVGTAATLVNPFGIGAWEYAAGIGANPAIAGQVTEWQRTTPFTRAGTPVLPVGRGGARPGGSRARGAALAGLAVAGGDARDRGLGGPRSRLVAVRGGVRARRPAGCAVARVPSPWALDASPASLPSSRSCSESSSWPPCRGGVPPTRSPAAPGSCPTLRPGSRRSCGGIAPAGTRVLAAQTWTSFLEWAVPDARYFLDSRFELFPADVWADRATIAAGGPDADEVLARRGVDLLVLPAGTDLHLAGWTVVYEDADGAILGPQPA